MDGVNFILKMLKKFRQYFYPSTTFRYSIKLPNYNYVYKKKYRPLNNEEINKWLSELNIKRLGLEKIDWKEKIVRIELNITIED